MEKSWLIGILILVHIIKKVFTDLHPQYAIIITAGTCLCALGLIGSIDLLAIIGKPTSALQLKQQNALIIIRAFKCIPQGL